MATSTISTELQIFDLDAQDGGQTPGTRPSGERDSLARAQTNSEPLPPNTVHSALLMATLSCVSFLNTFNSGVLTVALPTIAIDLGVPNNLLLWPASVYALALSCTLLPVGAVADVVGNRPVFLLGNMLCTAWTLAVSLAQTSNQLIAFRALQGIAMSFCMPTAVSTITTTFPSGKMRNIAFATFGGGSPLGFSVGLVLGGVFVKYANWRSTFYFSAAINVATFILASFTFPKSTPSNHTQTANAGQIWANLASELDWVGAGSISVCLALFSYIFAELTYSGSVMHKPANIVLLVIAVLLLPFFTFWEGRQERLGRPAMLPNSVWRRVDFTVVCVVVFLVWSYFNSLGYWMTLFFQETQKLSALQAALRFLPMVVVGVGINILAGLLVDKVPAGILVSVGGLISAVAPLLYAIQNPAWSYWVAAFPAMIVSVVATDLLFSVSNLVITTNFPSNKQALAGSIFNTVTQLGNSMGLAITAIIAASVTDAEKSTGTATDFATLKGYQAAFWTCFAAAVVSVVVSTVGLRKTGKVGAKKDL